VRGLGAAAPVHRRSSAPECRALEGRSSCPVIALSQLNRNVEHRPRQETQNRELQGLHFPNLRVMFVVGLALRPSRRSHSLRHRASSCRGGSRERPRARPGGSSPRGQHNALPAHWTSPTCRDYRATPPARFRPSRRSRSSCENSSSASTAPSRASGRRRGSSGPTLAKTTHAQRPPAHRPKDGRTAAPVKQERSSETARSDASHPRLASGLADKRGYLPARGV
jgi:hypothetical protein